ncbi:unnamed protein product, partial [marine sediment metagenome]
MTWKWDSKLCPIACGIDYPDKECYEFHEGRCGGVNDFCIEDMNGEVRSSYRKNNYGAVFRALIITHKPFCIVECGVLDGYSTFHIASALRFNYSRGYNSNFIAYDLWDKYDYNHGNFKSVVKELKDCGLLNNFVNIH